jgi:hypothetical protein
MCPCIPFQTSLTGQKRWNIVYAGHSSSLPNNMHTKFMCPSLYHFPNSSYRSEEMGTLVTLATVNLYPTTSSKFSKAWQKQICRISMKLPSHTTTLRIKNPPDFISIRIKTFFHRYDYTYCCNFQMCVCPKQPP